VHPQYTKILWNFELRLPRQVLQNLKLRRLQSISFYIERGLRAPSEAVVEALAASLDLSVEELYRAVGIRRTGDR
jgi:hypothetical protein